MENSEYYKRKAWAYLIIVLGIMIFKGMLGSFIGRYLSFLVGTSVLEFISIFIILVILDLLTKKLMEL